MNLPNKLTVLRMILVPFFVLAVLTPEIPHHYLIALAIFGIASYTDHLDGKIARRDHLITNFGKFMDPLADKILVISAMVCFVSLGLANTWMILLIIAREFLVTSIRLVAADTGIVIAANNWGKAKTVSQIIAIVAVLLLQYLLELETLGLTGRLLDAELAGMIGNGFILISTIFTVISGAIYLKENWGVIKDAK